MSWKRYIGWRKGHWLYKTSLVLLGAILLTAVLADFLANNKPILASENGNWKSPVVKAMLVKQGWVQWDATEANRQWKTVEYDWAIWPPVPYLPTDQDQEQVDVRPFHGNHVLGTDRIGRDLLSSMIHAVRIDLSIGLFAMLIAGIIGILLGGAAGFFGDDTIRLSRGQVLLSVLFLPLAIFYGFIIWQPALSTQLAKGFGPIFLLLLLCIAIVIAIMAIPFIVGKLFPSRTWMGHPVALPLDIGISRLIEVVVSIPVIYLLIMLVGATGGDSIIWVIVAIGLTRWTGIARFIRAEMLRIRELEYTESGRALGFSQWRLLLRHAAPNALPPALVAIAFGVANAILLESFLAFIGLGIPPDTPTWGGLLNAGRQDPSAWWMALFPGMAIFVTVLIFNVIGDQLDKRWAGRQEPAKKYGS